MGNSVFRYFLKWLRVQMREEAYERYVEQHLKLSTTSATKTASASGGTFWRRRAFTTPDEAMVQAEQILGSHDVDNKHQNTKDEKKDNKSDQSGRQYPQLYEIAKVEGDTEWIDWLGKHIWTYVGLSAPLLGAPGPLRSVLSGENMGLPFTDEEARMLEVCKSVDLYLLTMFIMSSNKLLYDDSSSVYSIWFYFHCQSYFQQDGVSRY